MIIKIFKKNKFTIIALVVTIFLAISIYSICFGMEEIENLEFNVGQVTANRLNVRRGPGIKYETVGILSKDAYIRVFAKIGNWYVIQTENNLIGAVYTDYIRPCPDMNLNNLSIETNSEPANSVDTKPEENSSEPVQTNLSVEEQEFLNKINEIRIKNNLPELKIDDNVENVARLKAQDLEENNYFSHTSNKYGTPFEMLTTSGVNYKTASENIAGNSSIDGAINSWMNSDSHKNNILSNNFNYTGVAVVHSNTYGKILVQLFIGQ